MKKFISKSLFGVAVLFGLSMCLTSCEDILGHWEKPTPAAPGGVTPTPIPEEVYAFSLRNLADDADIAATALKVTDQAGNPIVTAESDGKYTIKSGNLGSVTTLWLEATTATDKYIAKATKEELPAIAEAGKLKMATLGDLMGADGKFYADAAAITAASTSAIGVIGYLGNDATTEAIADGGGHGLVLCLKNAAENSNTKWSTEKVSKFSGQEVTSLAGLKRTENVSGYTNTATLTADAETAVKYPAAKAAKEYTPAAPAGTTGWFLPSAQQWVKMQEALGGLDGSTPELTIKWSNWFDNSHTAADKWEVALKKAGSGNYDSMLLYLTYWSSSEKSSNDAVRLSVDPTSTGGSFGFQWLGFGKNNTFRVRPVLAF